MKNYINTTIIIIAVIGVAIVVALIMTADQSDSSSKTKTTDTTTVQQKYGCAEDEVVYFGGSAGIECVSEEEDIRRQKGDS